MELKSEDKPARTPFRTIDTILPPEIYQALSAPARRVYCGVWNSSNWAQKNPIWIKTEFTCQRAKVTPEVLTFAQHELVEARLIEVQPGHHETKWTITDPDEPKQLGH